METIPSNQTWNFRAALLVLILFSVACKEKPGPFPVGQRPGDHNQTKNQDSIELSEEADFNNYHNHVAQRLQKNNDLIVLLKKASQQKRPQETAGFNPRLTDAEYRSTKLGKKMRQYTYITQAKWLAFKSDINKELEKLDSDLEELRTWWD